MEKSRWNIKPLDPAKLNIISRTLHQPPLNELINVLREGLTANFAEATVEVADYNADYNLCGNPIVLDIGGPSFLLPTVQRDKFYDVKTILRQLNYNTNAVVMGAGAGPWPRTADRCNCELIMKLKVSPEHQVVNGTHYAFVDKSNGKCVLQQVGTNKDDMTFALMANLYVCEGKPGKVIKVHAKKRTGKLDFIACMQKALESHYKANNKLVGLGGTFIMKNGKVEQHVMPEFSDTPLNSMAMLNNWLHFYDMETPLTAVGTFVSAETELDLRVQHFHSSSDENQLGGHYHIDKTPDSIEYEGYFNVANILYRIDQPSSKSLFGKD